MGICVEVDGSGFLVESLVETFPACSGLAVVDLAHLDRLTYWADLSVALDPSESAFWAISGAMLTAYAVVAGLRLVVKNIWLENSRV